MTRGIGTLGDIAARWEGFACPPVGIGKVKPLGQAVREVVRAGDLLYFGGAMSRPNAAMFEVARAFWGTSPGFTLAAPAIANQHAPLIHGGLVSRVISSIHGLTFPTPGPHPVYVKAAREGTVAFEQWSLLTLIQRLMAAALGLEFMPTRSLLGSDMADDLGAAGLAATMENPFAPGSRQSVVAPLAPDLTFVHVLASDAEGNALICPPLYDGPWAALAARRGVVLTTERIVDPSVIRRYPEQVRIPASKVLSVSEVPFGGHPNSLPGSLSTELSGYPDDYDFLADLGAAGRDEAALEAWTETWLTDCRDHEQYLAKLGAPRLHALRGRGAIDAWQQDWPAWQGDVPAPATANERHAVLATRTLAARLRGGDTSAILAGLGISSLAAWMAAMRLREEGRDIPLMVEAGMYGYLPGPTDPFLFNYRNMSGNQMLGDTLTTLGVYTAGAGNQAMGVLGAAQVDQHGNINTSKLPDLLLTGSGGANDIGSGAADVTVVIAHSRRRLVAEVDYVTTPGRAVRTIVTGQAVLRREDDGPFRLVAVLAQEGKDVTALVEEARAGTGWDLAVADEITLEPVPSADEIAFARQLDPQGLFLG